MSEFVTKLLHPIVSEKATELEKISQYAFLVPSDATKTDVKNAVFHLYGAKVMKVNMSRLPAKTRRVGRSNTRRKRASIKKAIVTLEGRKTLDVYKLKPPKAKKK